MDEKSLETDSSQSQFHFYLRRCKVLNPKPLRCFGEGMHAHVTPVNFSLKIQAILGKYGFGEEGTESIPCPCSLPASDQKCCTPPVSLHCPKYTTLRFKTGLGEISKRFPFHCSLTVFPKASSWEIYSQIILFILCP